MEYLHKSVIDHVTIMVSDLEQSIKWYTTSFSCELMYQTKTIAVLKFENIKLVLSLPSEQRPHLAYLKPDTREFGEILEQADLCKSTFIADPTGNVLELVETSIDEILS
jgi:catechol 2,3-dioxygenase-like lactoylglutathione lyase family enzyme